MHLYPQVHARTDEHIELPLLQPDKERVNRKLIGGYATPRNQHSTLDQNPAKSRLVFDGICNLCTTVARILFALDRGWRLDYTPYQRLSVADVNRYGLTEELLQGQMHFVRSDNSIASGTIAIGEICKLLTPFGLACNFLRTFPAQRLYGWIACRRYRLFGCRATSFAFHSQKSQGFD